jgi:hypothetical protein
MLRYEANLFVSVVAFMSSSIGYIQMWKQNTTSKYTRLLNHVSTGMLSETDIIKRLVLLIGNIFVLLLDVFLTYRQRVQNMLLFSNGMFAMGKLKIEITSFVARFRS